MRHSGHSNTVLSLAIFHGQHILNTFIRMVEAEKIDVAITMFKEYNLKQNDIFRQVFTMLIQDMKKGHYKRAMVLIKEFSLPEDKINEAGIASLKQKLKVEQYNAAITIANTFKLKTNSYLPILAQEINILVDKSHYEKALLIAREFKLKTPEAQKAAFQLFGVRLKN